MQITISQYAGFCDGVQRAFEMISELAKNPNTKRPILVLGSLVHNEDVVKKIETMGIRKADAKNWEKLIKDSHAEIGTLVITAHGMGPDIYRLAKQFNVNIVDTTCPRVIKAQKLAENFQKRGYQLVIVGERVHKEVKGINEWANLVSEFVETQEELEQLKLDPQKKIAIISQTTQNQDFVAAAGNYIKQKYPQAEIVDTLCLATHNRQSEIKSIALANDVVLVIGSPDSANSTRLFEISKSINKKSYFVERLDQLQKEWFKNCEKVGVTAGASTPKWIIDEILDYLGRI